MTKQVDFRYGKINIIDGDPVISKSIMCYGEWAQNEIEALSAFIKPSGIVLDIGAFIGTHTLAFSQVVGESGAVYAFEPRPEIFELLSLNVGLNPAKNVTVRLSAVGESETTLAIEPIDISKDENFGGFALHPEGHSNSVSRNIPCVTIDSINFEHIDFIKIDVEGMEPDVLSGATNTIMRTRPIIAVECNALSGGVKVLSFAKQAGYSSYGLLFDAFNPDNFFGNQTNFFGIARELSLVLIPLECLEAHAGTIEQQHLSFIDGPDSLALLLLHKPQYDEEVLRQTSVATVHGTEFFSSYGRATIDHLKEELSAASEQRSLAIKEKKEMSYSQRLLNEEISLLNSEKRELAEQVSVLSEARDASLHQIETFSNDIEKLQTEKEALENQLREVNENTTAEALRLQLSQVLQSRSWRVTSPLRRSAYYAREILHRVSRTEKTRIPADNDSENISLWEEFSNRTDNPAFGKEIIDIIVPVYKGLEETASCIQSVLDSRCNTPYELIVINDCSPELELSDWLSAEASRGKFTLLVNEVNLGFVGTVNRGMLLHEDRDVVLLNSDALVANDWLDRLFATSRYQHNVGTVTPFSTNATICSYPQFCHDNLLPDGLSLGMLDQLFASANRGHAIEIPTGVGFCLFIKRTLLDEIGVFDFEKFGRGYGEENDFCLRAIEAGYKNVLACDTFVQHLGAVSFGATADTGKQRAMEVLRSLYPNYERDIHRFIDADPIQKYRIAVDLARLNHSRKPVILHISHNRGGGTQRHIDEIANLTENDAENLILRPLMGTESVELQWLKASESFKVSFSIPQQYELLKQTLKVMNLAFIHFHHTIGLPKELIELPQAINKNYIFTVHDYYSICPQISLTTTNDKYCGELGSEQCRKCLSDSGRDEDIVEWRQNAAQFLMHAKEVIAPSRDVKNRLQRYFPELNVREVSHPEFAHSLSRPSCTRVLDRKIKVVVIGALSKIKGADRLQEAATDAFTRRLPIEYVLVGYGYRDLTGGTGTTLRTTGPYSEDALLKTLQHEAPNLIWFPAVWPETYSYTLSAAIAGGYAIAAPDLGAFRERLELHESTYLLPWDLSPTNFNDWVIQLFQGEGRPPMFTPRADIHYTDTYYSNDYKRLGDHDSFASPAPFPSFLHFASLLANQKKVRTWNAEIIKALRALRASRQFGWIAKYIPHNLQRRIRDKLGS